MPHNEAQPLQGVIPGYRTLETTHLRVRYQARNVLGTLKVFARVLLNDGDVSENQWQITPTTDGTVQTNFFDLPQGILINAGLVQVGNTPIYANVFAQLALTNGNLASANPTAILCQNYAHSAYGIFWPGTPVANPDSGFGQLITISESDPSAGATKTLSTGLNAMNIIVCIQFTFAAAAGGSDRLPFIEFQNGGDVIGLIASRAAVAATATVDFCFGQSLQGPNDGDTLLKGMVAIPAEFQVPFADDIIINADNIQAGDQFSDITWTMRRYFLPD